MTKEELFTELMNCRNELCLKCGAYRDSHLGACDGCRYNFENMAKWDAIEERPTGEWIDTGNLQEYWAEEYQCSLCGAKDHWHNYCPNCGAKMKQDEEDDNNG